MNKQQVRDRIMEIGIVPVVRASSAAEALLAAKAVCDGGIPIVEITMTVPGAVEGIRELRKSAHFGRAYRSRHRARRGDCTTLPGCWCGISGQPGIESVRPWSSQPGKGS